MHKLDSAMLLNQSLNWLHIMRFLKYNDQPSVQQVILYMLIGFRFETCFVKPFSGGLFVAKHFDESLSQTSIVNRNILIKVTITQID